MIDAKSGVTGAGRAAKEASLHAEVSEGLHAYGVSTHRHTPEIEQGLSEAAGRPVAVTFTPHLVPMNRGILATIYVHLAAGVAAEDLQSALERRYRDEPYARVLPFKSLPATRHVRGTNLCLIAVHPGPAARPRHPALGHRQSGQGRIGPGAAEHERDAGIAGGLWPRSGAPVSLSVRAAWRSGSQTSKPRRRRSRARSSVRRACARSGSRSCWAPDHAQVRDLPAQLVVQGPRRLVKLASLSEEERARGVIAMSAGNHAQGVAYHATRLGIPGDHRDAEADPVR